MPRGGAEGRGRRCGSSHAGAEEGTGGGMRPSHLADGGGGGV